jgi:hypothetical protein
MSALPQFLLNMLSNPPQAGNGVHGWLYDTARQLHAHYEPDAIVAMLSERVAQCGRPVPAREITSAVRNAALTAWQPRNRDADFRKVDRSCYLSNSENHIVTPPPAYESELLRRFAANIEDVVDQVYLAKRSKFTCANRSPAGFLQKLYRPGEQILIFAMFESQGQTIWMHPGLAGDLTTLDHYRQGCENVWFLIQPVDGQYHWNPREGKDSRRSEESVTAWRYAVAESDQALPDLWLKAVVQLPLPIVAIYSSGKKSIHVLIQIDAGSKDQWDRAVKELGSGLIRLGADKGALSAVRLSRLPNCLRGETEQLQALYYLDDDPDSTPICHKEVLR